jgi:peroxiredoxin
MILKPFFVFIFLSLSGILFAQQCTIEGNASYARQQQIRLKTWCDQISYRDSVITQTFSDSVGHFELKFLLSQPAFVWISIGFSKAEMYLEPGEDYALTLLPLKNLTENPTINPYLIPFFIDYSLKSFSGKTTLNALIDSVDRRFDRFVYSNLDPVNPYRHRSMVLPFVEEVQKQFAGVSDAYFQNYLIWKSATLELQFQRASHANLFKKYAPEKNMLYDNSGYMDFFNQYFQQYLTAVSGKIRYDDLTRAINQLQSLHALTDSLGKDSLLRNESLRELVFLQNAGELYNSGDFNKKTLSGFLKQLASESKFPQHRVIAANLLRMLTRFEKGSPAPDFTLTDTNGKEVSLSDFRGKYIYLGFFTSWCKGCLNALDTLQKTQQNYAGKVAFINISMDNTPEILKKLLARKAYSGIFLFSGNNFSLTDAYAVNSFPVFALIDPEGNFVRYPAPDPGEELEKLLDGALK